MRGRYSLTQLVVALMAASLLAGCSSGAHLKQLDAKLNAIKARPHGRIEPPPQFKAIATFTYSAQKLRSPFTPPTDQKLLAAPRGKHVKPDFSRPKEYLERFSLDSLKMVGTITKPGDPLEGLIQDPTGTVTMVKPGSHLGKNYGRVVEVAQDQIALVEIVPDGKGGWVQRSRNITLADQ